MERSKTYIDALDTLLGGGIPKNSVVLLSGPPGTGKTTLGMQYLINGAKRDGETGLYLTVSENELKIFKDFQNFDFFDKGIIDGNKVEIIDLRLVSAKTAAEKKRFTFFETLNIFEFLEQKVKHTNAKRIVIDSITALSVFVKSEQDFRDFFFFLSNQVSMLNCTAILISESNGEQKSPKIENFMSDGVINLNQVEKNNVLVKTFEIQKMRGTAHSSDRMRLDITKGGINLLPLIRDR